MINQPKSQSAKAKRTYKKRLKKASALNAISLETIINLLKQRIVVCLKQEVDFNSNFDKEINKVLVSNIKCLTFLLRVQIYNEPKKSNHYGYE
ncbi:hypothetical protein ABSA28_00973 [Candidatus Hepatincolaceae symbiont of Richtersius coronifer]